MSYEYSKVKKDPLSEEEVKAKYKDIKDELKEVFAWKKEEEAKLKNPKASHQKISAAKRALKKVDRRIDTVNGQIIYWKLRLEGISHFKASIEMNEYWAECAEKKKN